MAEDGITTTNVDVVNPTGKSHYDYQSANYYTPPTPPPEKETITTATRSDGNIEDISEERPSSSSSGTKSSPPMGNTQSPAGAVRAGPSGDVLLQQQRGPVTNYEAFQDEEPSLLIQQNDIENNNPTNIEEGSHTRLNAASVDVEASTTCHWDFANTGRLVGEFSRDGSIHATDEVFNSVSHLSALFVSVLGSTLLISQASEQGAPWKVVSFSIYGASLCFLFAASTVHHAISAPPKWERLFQIIDYISIYTLIAGTFTPMCLVYLPYSTIGWTFFGCVWFLSIVSIYVTAAHFDKVPKWFTTTIYITLGWFGAFLAIWIKDMMGWGGIGLLILGGVLYTVGGFIFTTEQPNPIPGRFGFHELWHLFVIFAAASHWFMMYLYVLPWQRPQE